MPCLCSSRLRGKFLFALRRYRFFRYQSCTYRLFSRRFPRLFFAFRWFAGRIAAVLDLFVDCKGKDDGIGDDAEGNINQAEAADALRLVHLRAQETSEIEHGAAVYSRQCRIGRTPVRTHESRNDRTAARAEDHHAYGQCPKPRTRCLQHKIPFRHHPIACAIVCHACACRSVYSCKTIFQALVCDTLPGISNVL